MQTPFIVTTKEALVEYLKPIRGGTFSIFISPAKIFRGQNAKGEKPTLDYPTFEFTFQPMNGAWIINVQLPAFLATQKQFQWAPPKQNISVHCVFLKDLGSNAQLSSIVDWIFQKAIDMMEVNTATLKQIEKAIQETSKQKTVQYDAPAVLPKNFGNFVFVPHTDRTREEMKNGDMLIQYKGINGDGVADTIDVFWYSKKGYVIKSTSGLENATAGNNPKTLIAQLKEMSELLKQKTKKDWRENMDFLPGARYRLTYEGGESEEAVYGEMIKEMSSGEYSAEFRNDSDESIMVKPDDEDIVSIEFVSNPSADDVLELADCSELEQLGDHTFKRPEGKIVYTRCDDGNGEFLEVGFRTVNRIALYAGDDLGYTKGTTFVFEQEQSGGNTEYVIGKKFQAYDDEGSGDLMFDDWEELVAVKNAVIVSTDGHKVEVSRDNLLPATQVEEKNNGTTLDFISIDDDSCLRKFENIPMDIFDRGQDEDDDDEDGDDEDDEGEDDYNEDTPLAKVTREDVIKVATSNDEVLTEEEIAEVISKYPEAQRNDPTGGWDLAIEQCISEVIGDRKPVQSGKKQRPYLEGNFVLTGDFKAHGFPTRDLVANIIKQHGGFVQNAVTQQTNFLVVGNKPGNDKLNLAERYGVTQISYTTLIKTANGDYD